MKLAEALLLRTDLQKKLASLRERIGQNAVVQEGDKPYEDPNKLLDEAFAVSNELESLVRRINEANLSSLLADGRSLTAAIAHRDTLTQQHSLLQAAVEATQRPPDRYGISEIKWVAILKIPKLQKQSEEIAKKLRELNAAIQETNWNVEFA